MRTLLWKAPEQNGFVSLHAEVFPSMERTGLAGCQKGISLLVTSKEIDMHLLSEETPNLIQWYTFEGGLNSSITKADGKQAIEPAGTNRPKWMPSNGTFGLASGFENAFKLPVIPITNNGNDSWKIVSRFKPLNEGEVFSVQFGSDVTMTLNNNTSALVLTLADSSKTFSETLKLPEENDSFITVAVKFSIQAGRLSAKMAFVKPGSDKPAFINEISKKEPLVNPIGLSADFSDEIKIILGQQKKPSADNSQPAAGQKQTLTALWDELAVFRFSGVEIISVKDKKDAPVETEPPETITRPMAF